MSTYITLHRPNHPRAAPRGAIHEHILIAEKALGCHLPKGTEVHHVNGDKKDNRSGNLVICQDRSYHKLLHRRASALNATGNPNALKCKTCKEWDLEGVNEMRVRPQYEKRTGRTAYGFEHGACNRMKQREWYKKRNKNKA